MTRRLLAFGAGLGLAACGGLRVVSEPVPEGLGWPPGDPRIRLERVIQLQRGGGWLASLTGAREVSGLLDGPHSVAWLGDDLVVTEPSLRRLTRIAADGRVTTSPEGILEAPLALASCPQGLVVTDAVAGRLALLDATLGFKRWLAEGLERPTGVACTGGVVYVTETARHAVVAIGSDGTLRTFGTRGGGLGQFNFPTALAASDGRVFVGDSLNFRVQVLDATSGAPITAFGTLGDAPGQMPRLKGLALDAQAHLWVSDAHLDRISLYTRDGELLVSFGGRGPEPGRFSFPAGIAAHSNGRVAVVDALNRRIQVFRLVAGEGNWR